MKSKYRVEKSRKKGKIMYTLKKCDLLHKIKDCIERKDSHNVLCVFGDKYFGKHKLSQEIEKYLSKNCTVVIYKNAEMLIERLNNQKNFKNDCSSEIMLTVIHICEFEERLVIEVLDRLEELNKLKYTIVLLMRPNKKAVKFFELNKARYSADFLLCKMSPDDSMESIQIYKHIRTPRLNEIRKPDKINKYLKDDIYAYRWICSDNYYSDVCISPINTEMSLMVTALIFGGVMINNVLVGDINMLLNKCKKPKISCNFLRNSNDYCKTSGKYEVIDGWREFLIYKRYHESLLHIIKDFYLSLYYRKYLKLEIQNDEIVCLRSEIQPWYNAGFTNYYKYLYSALKYRKKKKHIIDGICEHGVNYHSITYIPYKNLRKLSEVISEYAGNNLTEYIQLAQMIFLKTFNFNLLLNAIEILYVAIEKGENISVHTDFMKFVAKYAARWKEITIIDGLVSILAAMIKDKQYELVQIESVLEQIHGFPYETIKNIIMNYDGGEYLMNTLKKAKQNKKVFISYHHTDADIADLVYDALRDILPVGYEILKYDHDIHYKDNINDYMNQIDECQNVVMIVSDAYLRSEGCMYEVTETMRDRKYINKMLPIFIKKEDIQYYDKKNRKLNPISPEIFDKIDKNIYGKYWLEVKTEQENYIAECVKNNKDSILIIEESTKRLKKITNIILHITTFVQELITHWQYSFKEMYDQNFEPIIREIMQGDKQ